jgi:enamine deaminase RidA (YjgF/YER057c/UK114 family)
LCPASTARRISIIVVLGTSSSMASRRESRSVSGSIRMRWTASLVVARWSSGSASTTLRRAEASAVTTLDRWNGADVAVERTAVNPVTWSVAMGFNQGELVSGATRTLYCSGQTAMSGDGEPMHAGDIGAQLALSLDNLEAVLGEAGMSLANLVRLNVYTTDVDLLFPEYGVLASRLAAVGVAPTTTMLGVSRLAIPGQLVELEGTAVA